MVVFIIPMAASGFSAEILRFFIYDGFLLLKASIGIQEGQE
jgi:hypothetical protein